MRDVFDRGLAELERHLSGLDDDALSRAVEAFREAVASTPGNGSFHLALAFALDADGNADAALLEAGEAARLDPDGREAEVLRLTLLAERGEEGEALSGIAAAAPRHGVDVEALRRELEAADMPTDALTLLGNGFLSPRNWIRSWLLDEIGRASREESAGGPSAGSASEAGDCVAMQEELLRESASWKNVPEPLQPLVPWAARMGIGDDVCRPALVASLSPDERSELRRRAGEAADGVHAWLEGLGSEPIPPAAAAFMYLLLAVEEMD